MERLQAWSWDHPGASTFVLATEQDAEDLLMALAITFRRQAARGEGWLDREKALEYAQAYLSAVADCTALDYIRSLTKKDAIVIYTLKIETPRELKLV